MTRAQPTESERQPDPQPREVVMDDIAAKDKSQQEREWATALRNRTAEIPPGVMFAFACATCHGRIPSAPTVERLRSLSPEQIYAALATGVMKNVIPEGLTDDDKRG